MSITKKSLDELVKTNIGNYSYNINLFRSFPSIEDGMKTVQRRVLYEMGEMKLTSGVPHKKVAAIVGQVLGHTHPHGDSSVADALVKMSQDFYMSYPLCDISGNNGSISGDPAAAMRYIEGRMSKIGTSCLEDIHKNAVNWKPNFDNSSLEPETLPVKYPMLLLNGSFGIGQAYISSIPSHNFADIVELMIKVINNPNITLDEIANNLIPDYPTGGVIINKSELVNAYKTGSGNVKLRAKINTNKNGDLVVTQIPYMTTVGAILDKIQEVCKDGRIDGISDIVDQTNEKNGVRIVIKIKRGYDANTVENQLYQLTPLQSTLQLNLIAVEGTTFRQYNILELFTKWLEYRKTTLKRIFNFNMSKIRKRIHIIDGLLICLADIDNVVALIKTAKDRKDTVSKLMKQYNLSEIQAEAIADLQLYRLSNMSIKALKDEKKQLNSDLNNYTEYFTDPNKLNNLIIEQLEEGKEKYGRERLTEAIDIDNEEEVEATIPDTNHTIFVTKEGFIKKLTLDMQTNTTNCQGRSIGKMKEKDVIVSAINVNNKDNLMLFTNMGRMFILKVYDLKDTNVNSFGILINTYINLKPNEKVVSALSLTNSIMKNEDAFLVFITKNGMVKRTLLNQYKNANKSGLIAINLGKEDSLVGVRECIEGTDIIIATNKGGYSRFSTEEVSLTNRTTVGVKATNLNEGDFIVDFEVVSNDKNYAFIIDTNGQGKRIDLSTLQQQSRTNSCKMITKLKNEATLVSLKLVNDNETITVVSTNNMVKVNAEDVPVLIRSASPKPVFKLAKGDSVVDCYTESKS